MRAKGVTAVIKGNTDEKNRALCPVLISFLLIAELKSARVNGICCPVIPRVPPWGETEAQQGAGANTALHLP